MFYNITSVLDTVRTNKMHKDYENWLRLVILNNSIGKSLSCEILHKKK